MEVLGMEEGKKPEDHMTSAAAFVEGGIQDSCDDACSICLEEFSESDPSTVTSCKHEFHLQCVLEWCQRSSQCPMCWQPISLKDATSQELLEAVEQERSIRANPPRNATIFHHPTFGDFELQHLPVGASDTDLEERILQHLTAAAAMGRAHHFGRRESHRNRSAAHGRPHFFVFSAHPGGAPPGPVAQGGGTEPATLAGASPSVPLSSSGNDSSQHMLQFHPIQTNQNSSSASGSAVAQATRRGFSFNNRHTSSPTHDRAGPSDLQSFSESLKSRFNAVSMRYKESISKSTRGWKERLFSRNASMPGTGSESRSENAGITSVSHLMEQLGTGESTRGSEASVSSHMANTRIAMGKKDLSEWRLDVGQYLGEISALCFVHLPSHLSSLPFLLAGSGSQVLLYDLEAGTLIRPFQVFQGIRLHGISCNFINCTEGSVSTRVTFEVALFGEKRVKLFELNFELSPNSQYQPETCVNLSLVRSLPRLSHWVFDVCFLKVCNGNRSLAIGCSDNSIRVWDISNSSIILEVHSPERCLLYSMKLWGDNLEALRIASGTIYNEIIVWKVDWEHVAPLLNSPEGNHAHGSSSDFKCFKLQDQQHTAVNLFRLVGHEGSIFRIEWSSCGSKLVSVSDDRSARIWEVRAEYWKDSDSIEEVGSSVLYGHNARVWDCCLTDSFIITAGEDCTCRVWGSDGKQLKMIKEHIGRGIWRCLYDPLSSLLVTAGFDSAIKVHQFQAFLPGSLESHPEAKEFNGRTEIFSLKIPNFSEQIRLTDSKSEYVRCLHLTSEDTLYIATNHGYLYHTKLCDMDSVNWNKILQVSEGMPIICMDLLSNEPKYPCGIDDWVALGDGKGNMTIVRVVGDVHTPQLSFTFTWSAGIERQLLGTYWCKSLGHRFIFTADPKGRLKLWRLCDPFSSVCYESSKTNNVFLVVEFSSCFGARIMCLDASFEDEVLFCGDLRGNLVLFPLLRDLLNDKSVALHVAVSPLNYFKGAHGISTVSNVSVAKLRSNQTEIRSTGGDGCICYLEYDKDRESLEFIGMKQVKELSLIQSVSAENNSIDLASCNYAAGFASTDFIIWNLITEAKVVQIPCGGWRRPHSYFLGDVPEIKNCFAYVKDEVIHIHRHWISNGERKMFPKNLHMQFHGREIHTLCFVSENFQVGANVKKSALNKSSWIATGCEDGTVRLTRYSPGFENWSSSKLLGEHVGGSAVRSICFVSEINQISAVVDNVSEEINRQNGVAEDKENPFLLISVGAKRVLTSWLLRHRGIDEMEETTVESKYNRNGNDLELSLGASSSLSFQWLSTDMPTKNSSTHGKKKDIKKVDHITRNIASMNANEKTGSISSESREREAKAFLGDKYEDDWRYLAVTAFLVKCPGSRLTVCFVVVACSDATLALRALILPLRLWFEVAMLVPLSSPVLALQHVIMPIHLPSKENVQIGSSYFVISGATDGSIAFWDVTGHVEAFVQQVSTLHIENFIDCQKRPRTGRGSQGGRWWRNLRHTRPNKESGSSIVSVRTEGGVQNHDACGVSANVNDTENCTVEDGQIASCEPELNAVNSTSETSEIRPIHILKAHQSGVNCLHVSKIKNCWSTECGFHFYVVSGGDDQAIHCLRVDLSLLSRGPDSEIIAADVINSNSESEDVKSLIYYGQEQNQNYRIRFYNYFRATSAHSSAIKGIWTDGTWVFSTGLDQRIRFWLLEEHSILSQHAHLVVSVPEPEALSARACGRNHYEIAVAGRGMQMVEFHASTDIDEEQ